MKIYTKNYMAEKIKNYCLYGFGLVVLILNKVKHLFFQYDHPRPIPAAKIKDNIAYDRSVVLSYEVELKKYCGEDFSLAGKNILEIGPGPDLGNALLFLDQGAASYTAVDRFNLSVVNDEFYKEILEYSFDKERLQKVVNEIKSSLVRGKKNISLPEFKYLNFPAEDLAKNLGEQKFDLILSWATLEHLDSIDKFFSATAQVLAPDGTLCHLIDFKTHTGLVARFDPLNIYRFSDRIYNFLKFAGAPSRKLLSDYLLALRSAGFSDLEIVNREKIIDFKIKKIKPYLARAFQDRGLEDLSTMTAIILAKK